MVATPMRELTFGNTIAAYRPLRGMVTLRCVLRFGRWTHAQRYPVSNASRIWVMWVRNPESASISRLIRAMPCMMVV